ncbi:hypothetical protein ACLB1G_13750 [Oxalobacteraceae bacterium A2-2]
MARYLPLAYGTLLLSIAAVSTYVVVSDDTPTMTASHTSLYLVR